MSARKTVFLIADGMGDWPVDDLGGRTPLEAADTPRMDALAREGVVGLCRTIPKGMPPGSDIANMALLGCDPATHHTGRGPIEAAAQGLVMDPDDLVWRCNLVRVSTLEPDGIMQDYSAGHIDTPTATALVEMLQSKLGGTDAAFHPGVQYRHLVVQPGRVRAAEAGLAIRPPHDILDQTLGPDLTAYQQCPDLWRLMREAALLLGNAGNNASQANAVWLWGQGRPLHLPDFQERFGQAGAVISAVDLIKGLGRATGMAVLDVPGATGYLDTNYAGKVAAALDFLQQGDFVFLHVEAPDECGHQGSLENKVRAIADFDARVVGPIRDGLHGMDAAILVACDHFTPLIKRTHVPDPVPFLFWHADAKASGVPSFSETLAASSGLMLERGEDLLPWALQRSER